MYELYIANKNYSSWSLRPWVLMRALGIPFIERLLTFGDPGWSAFRRLNPAGKVPCLVDGSSTIWESLAIVEYLAEAHGGLWPSQRNARAWARAAAAEMHAGFPALRNRCPMSCGITVRLAEVPAALTAEIARLEALWSEGLDRFGGPYLAGSSFTAVDAFFAPVAFRIQTYGLALGTAAGGYATCLLELPAMRAWYADAVRETARDVPHEEEVRAAGVVTSDVRAAPR